MIKAVWTWLKGLFGLNPSDLHAHPTLGDASLPPLSVDELEDWINAGDLRPAFDIKSDVLSEGSRLANDLRLPRSEAFFSQTVSDIERNYFDQFEVICSEVEAAYQAMLESAS